MAPSTSSADDHVDSCPVLIIGSATLLHPEGVAYSPDQNRFLVGSVMHGTVSVAGWRGSVRTLVDDPADNHDGLAVDVHRGRLLVVNGDIGISGRSTPDTIGKTAWLGTYDVHNGARGAYHDLAALDLDHDHFGNDVIMTKTAHRLCTRRSATLMPPSPPSMKQPKHCPDPRWRG